jgi:DUF3040 family protein
MLSEYEQRELATIEEQLLRDPDLSACFQEDDAAARRAAPRPLCLVVPGILIMAAAVFLGVGAALAQGLGLVVLGMAWSTATNARLRRRARLSIKYCIEAYERSWPPPAHG